MSSKPRERKCASCRFYQASPLWRKGWCRNPLLYDAQTNHLVEAESLACSRTFIDYWEPRRLGPGANNADGTTGLVRRAPSIPMQPTGPGGAPLRSAVGTVAAVQAANQPRERPPQLSLVRPEPRSAAAPDPPPDPTPLVPPGTAFASPPLAPPESPLLARVGPIGTPSDVEVARTDAPHAHHAGTIHVQQPVELREDRRGIRTVLSAALLVALAVAAFVFLRPPAKPAAVTPTVVPPIVRPPALVVVPPTARPPTATRVPAPTPVPTPGPLVMAVGANVQVTGLGNSTLRVHTAPGVAPRVVGALRPGVTAHIVAGPQNADGVVWWQITGWDAKNTPAWASGKYLQPVR